MTCRHSRRFCVHNLSYAPSVSQAHGKLASLRSTKQLSAFPAREALRKPWRPRSCFRVLSHSASEPAESKVKEDGCVGSCCEAHGSRLGNKTLTAVFKYTGLQSLSDLLTSTRLTICTAVALFCSALFLPLLFPCSAVYQASTALTVGVYALLGLPGLIGVCYDVVALRINTHVLTMFAVFCLVPLGHALEGALLLLLFNLSHELEDALTVKARGNLRALFDSVPSKATVLKLGPDGEPDFATEQLVPAEDIAIGELVAVRAGQELALDGVVIRGEALLSMEHITGESVPQHCKVGDMVPAGAMNNDGLLIIRVATIAANSTPARMARLAREAQENKPRVQTILESIGSRYSQFVLVGTVAVALLLPLLAGIPFLGSPGSPGSLYRAACFLTTAAPCAILMGPLVYVSSIAAATQRGILLKGASVIDALAGCRVAALDKTGTLTTGALTCNHAEDLWREGPGGARAGSRNGELAAGADPKAISIVLALSQVSLHPVSKAVVEAFGPNGDGGDLPAVQLESHSVIPGRGVRGECAATGSSPPEKVFFGSQEHAESLLKELGHEAALEALRRSCGGTETGKIISLLVRESGGKLAGLHVFRFGDRLHQSSHEALNSIRSRGIKLAMLSGDNAESALAMARRLGLQEGEIRGGLRPEDKLEQVEGLRQQHGPVLMIGDGINDAPALAAADIGLAIAPTPSTTAAAAADGVILSGAGPGVSSVPFLLSLAGFTRKLVIQNFVLAGLAILGSSLPAVAGVLPLWVGVAIHEGSTLLVALNSLRPLMHRPPAPRGAKSAAPAPAEGLRSPGRRQAADADKPGDEALVFQSTAAAS